MKVINNGLSLFPLRSWDDRKNISDTELPPIYSSFLGLYKVGRTQKMLSEVYLDERYNEKIALTRCVNELYPNNIFLGGLFLPEESVEIMSRVYDVGDDIHGQNLFLIGEDATGHYFFMVGTGNDNMDQVFVESVDYSFPGGKRITKLTDNIYLFLKSFVIVEMDDGIGYGVEYEQLYKNWNEDFWRVRK